MRNGRLSLVVEWTLAAFLSLFELQRLDRFSVFRDHLQKEKPNAIDVTAPLS
jgi:hypothetical protein